MYSCHTIRSIHTTAAGVSRHRITTEDPRLPWQFRMNLYVFPATREECCLSDSPLPQIFDCDLKRHAAEVNSSSAGYYDESGQYRYE